MSYSKQCSDLLVLGGRMTKNEDHMTMRDSINTSRLTDDQRRRLAYYRAARDRQRPTASPKTHRLIEWVLVGVIVALMVWFFILSSVWEVA